MECDVEDSDVTECALGEGEDGGSGGDADADADARKEAATAVVEPEGVEIPEELLDEDVVVVVVEEGTFEDEEDASLVDEAVDETNVASGGRRVWKVDADDHELALALALLGPDI
jgi:hypothetical protein